MKHITLIILVVVTAGAFVFLVTQFVTGTSWDNPEASKPEISQSLPDTTDQASGPSTEDIINQYTWVTFEHPSTPFNFEYPQELSMSPDSVFEEFPSYVDLSINFPHDEKTDPRYQNKQINITAIKSSFCLDIAYQYYCPDTTEIKKPPTKIRGYDWHVYDDTIGYGIKQFSNVKRYVLVEGDTTYMLTYYKDYSTSEAELQEPDKKYEVLFDRIASSFKIKQQKIIDYSMIQTVNTKSFPKVENMFLQKEEWNSSDGLQLMFLYPSNILKKGNVMPEIRSIRLEDKSLEFLEYTNNYISFSDKPSSGYFPQEVLGMIDGEPTQAVSIAGQLGYVKEGTINRLDTSNATQVKVYTFEKDNYVYIFAYYKAEGKDFTDTFDGIVSSLEIVEKSD